MKRALPLAALLACLPPAALLYARERKAPVLRTETPAVVEDGIAVYFSPKGGCEGAVVSAMEGAEKTIDFQAYSFTSTEIAKALAEAKDRGVKVRCILDRVAAGTQYSGATYLHNHGVPTWLDGSHPIAHNKIVVIDGETVLTGSFNFTRQAENSNAENLLVIDRKPKIAAAYAENFEKHLAHSKEYEGPKEAAKPAEAKGEE